MLSACGASRPVKYYSLDVDPPTGSTAIAAPQFPVRLLVARVVASHLYRDDRLVYGYDSPELGTYEYQRWAESPVDLIQDAIVSSLRASGRYRSVSGVASNLRGEYLVRTHLYALEEVDKPSLVARFSLQMELYDPRSQSIVWSQTYTHDEPVKGKKVPDVVEALEVNVISGIAQLNGSLGQYFADHATTN
jgi:ABC-type uncharacterized transport system auxiliary subunit